MHTPVMRAAKAQHVANMSPAPEAITGLERLPPLLGLPHAVTLPSVPRAANASLVE